MSKLLEAISENGGSLDVQDIDSQLGDEEAIHSAISALTNGGRVMISDGMLVSLVD